MRRIPFQSIELLPDADAAARLREDWRLLQAAGLSSLGARPDGGNTPHLTLVAAPAVPHPSSPFRDVLPIAALLGPPELLGDSAGDSNGDNGSDGASDNASAGGRRALVRPVVAPPELLALRARVHDATPGADARPWRPHLTLARRLRADQLPEALAALGERADAQPTAIRFVVARHWDPGSGRTTELG